MLKLFIADDDKILRRGLRTIIEENGVSCQIVGEASNGAQALEKLKAEHADVLITDIKMPVMDGVELIKNVRELGLKTKIIVFSGFDEYKYVRETLKHGALDYLLKPIENKALLELIERARAEIGQEREAARQAEALSEQMSRGIVALRARFVERLIRDSGGDNGEAGERDDREAGLAAQLRQLGVDPAGQYGMAVVSADSLYPQHASHTRHSADFLRHALEPLTDRGCGRFETIALVREADAVLLFAGRGAASFRQDAERLVDELRAYAESHGAFALSAGLSREYGEIGRTAEAYREAALAEQGKFYEGTNRTYAFDPEACRYEGLDERQPADARTMEALQNGVEIGNAAMTHEALESVFGQLLRRRPQPAQFKDAVKQVVNRMCGFSHEFADHVSELEDEGHDAFRRIGDTATLGELKRYVLELFGTIAEKMAVSRTDRGKKIIEQAKQFIRKQYNEDISLKAVAEHVQLNPNYFSELFRNETGKKYVDFVIECRINEAKKLLSKPDFKVYEVGMMVGYDEPVSFNRAFKKVVGISPAEYKKIVT